MSSSSSENSSSRPTGGPLPRSSEVLRSAVDLFVLAATHERAEIRAFADLLGGLLPDATIADRVHVAQRLAHRADTPPQIARLLAMDAPRIAEPVVLRSPVLTSADLVEIMRRGPEHVGFVAERLDLSPDVVLALGRGGDLATRIRPAAGRGEPEAEAETIEQIVIEAARAKPIGDADIEAETALQRALDELAAELEAEASAHEAEEAAARALRAAMPRAPGDIDELLGRDPAGRWRYIQEFGSTAALTQAPPRRRRSDDPAEIGALLLAALVAKETDRLAEELARAARLERVVADRILTDRHGEALAITLAALGVDERTATSILLLHQGERASLAHMQDLSAMAGRIGWRNAEHILSSWRGERGRGRGEAMRVVDPAERRGGREAAQEAARGAEDLGRRRTGEA